MAWKIKDFPCGTCRCQLVIKKFQVYNVAHYPIRYEFLWILNSLFACLVLKEIEKTFTVDILLFVSLQFINSPVESKYIVDFCLPTYKSNLAFLCSRFLAQSKLVYVFFLFLHSLNSNNFFPTWILIVLTYYIRETSRNKLKKHSVTKGCSELSLFE